MLNFEHISDFLELHNQSNSLSEKNSKYSSASFKHNDLYNLQENLEPINYEKEFDKMEAIKENAINSSIKCHNNQSKVVKWTQEEVNIIILYRIIN